MNPQDLPKAKNPDLIASLTAIRRAAQAARATAVQTGTAVVVVRDHQVVRVPAETLRQEARG
jgi:hypothetical protein